jgi:hypothetical protein
MWKLEVPVLIKGGATPTSLRVYKDHNGRAVSIEAFEELSDVLTITQDLQLYSDADHSVGAAQNLPRQGSINLFLMLFRPTKL